MNISKTSSKIALIVAVLLMSSMAGIMLYEAKTYATIMDESPHIVAGYSYVVEKEYRLNPEHPPLIKALAALPLVFKNLNFPSDSPAWQDKVNGQWQLGAQFIFEYGNDANSMMFWSRLGPILITLLLGFLIFKWVRELYGDMAGLFALALYSFSPTFLAHGPLVTTDVGAALAFFFATYYLIKYLKKQTRRNLVWAGLAFGIAQLMKFSLIILLPYFSIVVLLWILFKDRPLKTLSTHTLKRIVEYFGKLILIGVIGMILVYPVYQYTVWNYAPDRQVADTTHLLESAPFPAAKDAVIWMADKPILRAYAQFFLGHLMVLQRVSGGNTTYFLGQVSSSAWPEYFPVVFALKVPLALLVLILMSVGIMLSAKYKRYKISIRSSENLKEKVRKSWHVFMEWGDKYFVEFASGLFILLYWWISIMGNLNIGIRHILPTLPFLYILLASAMRAWGTGNIPTDGLDIISKIQIFISSMLKRWLTLGIVSVLLLWYVLSSLSAFPNYIAYFNGIAGGANNGYKYVVDSNLDWGQDLRRLADYVEKNNIQKIRVDYFGGGSPSYYLKDKYERMNPYDKNHRKGWIAVSATYLQNGRGIAAKGFNQNTTYYKWLDKYNPVAKVGYSIFIYYIP